ncbi:hypothetical protein B0H17DRAFT_1111512 [Mycena rosella]|uniref:Uncharacterized protein n=1 Tax=Mycena rosella TaxID=1033263 RepID=A0AAD7FKB5_MYCRO|nr:hypothetical protein B0H17DRAFT_1111512 [Mycena rosella]
MFTATTLPCPGPIPRVAFSPFTGSALLDFGGLEFPPLLTLNPTRGPLTRSDMKSPIGLNPRG